MYVLNNLRTPALSDELEEIGRREALMAISCREAITQLFSGESEVLRTSQVIDKLYASYPNRPWKENSIGAHLIGLSVNHRSSIHYPYCRRHGCLFSLGNGRYRKWNPAEDGTWGVVEGKVQQVKQPNTPQGKVTALGIYPGSLKRPPSIAVARQPDEVPVSTSTFVEVTIDDLSRWRRGLVQLLGRLDGGSRDGVGSRIRALSRSGRIPREHSSLMIAIAEMRNVAEYDQKRLSRAEGEAIRHAWVAVVEWAQTQGIKLEQALPSTPVPKSIQPQPVQAVTSPEAPRSARGTSSQKAVSRGSKRESRVPKLIAEFPRFLQIYNRNPPFTRTGQLEHHVETIQIRRKLGSAVRALADPSFLESLHRTLQAWGIGVRASKLAPLAQFGRMLSEKSAQIAALDKLRIDDPALDVAAVSEKLWHLIHTLGIVSNETTIVPGTKALHHILPDLVVPVDRAYTQKFFGWHSPQFQYGQSKVFQESFAAFAEIARSVNPAQYVGLGWNSSLTKVIDNAIVGMLYEEEKG